jgi:hypothetical protein
MNLNTREIISKSELLKQALLHENKYCQKNNRYLIWRFSKKGNSDHRVPICGYFMYLPYQLFVKMFFNKILQKNQKEFEKTELTLRGLQKNVNDEGWER